MVRWYAANRAHRAVRPELVGGSDSGIAGSARSTPFQQVSVRKKRPPEGGLAGISSGWTRSLVTCATEANAVVVELGTELRNILVNGVSIFTRRKHHDQFAAFGNLHG